ncbi:MAG: SigE family RNA polymerase sigma factor [Actinomycetota bacterium]
MRLSWKEGIPPAREDGEIAIYQGSGVLLEAGRSNERDRDRDRELTALFLEHHQVLRRLAYVMLGDASLAEEVVMDAFAKAVGRWNLLSSADHPNAYLRQIVMNLCRSKVRRKILERKVSRLFDRDEPVVYDPDMSTYGVNIEVWRAVQRLPERQKACVVLRYLDDLTEPEVARVLDIPVGTVKSQLSRARAKLSDWLGADIEEPA